ncbi:MAG: GTPase RsgA, partial [Clostridia bacterium]|nr:GTPase RsgA [Clostridia bacterium]
MNIFKGRIISQYKDLYKIAMTNEELTGEVSGKFRFSATSPASFPAVGDYVMVDRESYSAGNGIIHGLIPRKSLLARKAAGNEKITQIIAANIDYIFICMSLNNDFNLRRIERYLAIAWDSGAAPVIVLTKADLADNLSEKLQEVEEIAPGVDVIITSMENDDDHLQVLKYIKEGKTGAFVGSSGVGKSTLINKVLGKDVIKTSEIRNDDKGRHTTTRRDLFILPNG